MSEPSPLFVTRFSLSARSAIGVQTELMMRDITGAQHIYWEQRDFRRYSNSRRIENLLVSRFSPLRQHSAFGLSRRFWKNDCLTDEGRKLVLAYKPRISSLYLAPLSISDVRRMTNIVEIIDKPYVVHVWDILTDDVKELQTLINGSRKLYYLTEVMADKIWHPDMERLLFHRRASRVRAAPPDGCLRIAMIGDVTSYVDGVEVLTKAVKKLRALFDIKIIYVGSWGNARRLPPHLLAQIDRVGFLNTDDGRDVALANCNIAFLPGPEQSPESNLRSKYSIPSRLLDYLAVGLPIVGAVHPVSATARLVRELGLNADAICATSSTVAEAISRLSDAHQWTRSSDASLQAFDMLAASKPWEKLREALANLY